MPELPKQFDHLAAQARCRALWDADRSWHAEPAAPGDTRPVYSIVIPPPNVTGALHLGHALNNTLQDLLVRTRRMQGFLTLWMPGTDHAGIATQAVVERRLLEEEKLSRHDLGRDALVARIWAWKEQYEKRILGQLRDLGASCDWDRTRFTLDDQCAGAVRAAFFGLFKQGLVRRGKRLVNWDTFLHTAVSDDEVFHEQVKGHFWHIRYDVVAPQAGEPVSVTVATTRPETLLGDTAVAVHPDPATALDAAEAALWAKRAEVPAKEQATIDAQLEEIAVRRRDVLPTLVTLAAMARAGRHVRLPLLGREIPLVADEWAKPEMGSGCVKITPAHDPNDYDVGRRCDLPMVNILNPDGTLNDAAGPYAGLTIPKARTKVVADLEASGQLVQVEDRLIELAHSDRSKTPIEPYLADQWFIRMDELAQPALDAVTSGRVRIVPERYAKTYLDWLSEKRDWPVSRQLWWGHRIPIWHVAGVTEADLAAAFGGRDTVAWTADGAAGWFVCSSDESLPIETVAGKPLVRDPDVLDTWFSSALWPHSTLGWPRATPELACFYPTSTLVTSRDILTLWVARMVILGLFDTGASPFREVYIHPKILDRYGETMSKSKGNGVDPVDVIDTLGADALRFALASMATETQDVRMPVDFQCPACGGLVEQTVQNRIRPRIDCPKCGQPFRTQWATAAADLALPRGPAVSERFESGRNFSNKLWNATRFVLMHLEGFDAAAVDAAAIADPSTAELADRWLASRLASVTRDATRAIDEYKFAEAARVLYAFAWDEFCSAYLELCKPRLADPATRDRARAMLLLGLDTILRLLHPIMPFVTEEIWQHLGETAAGRRMPWDHGLPPRSIMVAAWPRPPVGWIDPHTEAQFGSFLALVAAIREVRARQNVPPRTRVKVAIRTARDQAERLQPLHAALESMAVAEITAIGPDAVGAAAAATAAVAGCEISVDLAGLIDVEAEIAKLIKENEKTEGFIKAKQAKLADEKFAARAPEAVVAKERAQLAELEERLAKGRATLADMQHRGATPG
ncbi:MAG: class I tRNA ligase family protein [Planctomycetaceae bacterium]|nr:class I tRNA ligase family protein [Planctomycetaceae bacterium]